MDGDKMKGIIKGLKILVQLVRIALT